MKLLVLSDTVAKPIFRRSPACPWENVEFEFDAVDQFESSLLQAGHDAVIVFLSPLAFGGVGASEAFDQRLCGLLSSAEIYIQNTAGTLLINMISFQDAVCNQSLLVARTRWASRINERVMQFSERHANSVVIVQGSDWCSPVFNGRDINHRSYGVMRAPFDASSIKLINSTFHDAFLSQFTAKKKVIFCDADNTLWGGVLGEDGVDGIAIGENYPGINYLRLQEFLVSCKANGILLALVTKNNLEDIEEVFAVKEMPLKLQDFIEVRSNWNPKSENILSIFKALNVGVSSGLFIDDNEFELQEVRAVLEELDVFKIDGKAVIPPHIMLARSPNLYFTNVTEEDRAKHQKYEDAKKREAFSESVETYDEFLSGLGIMLTPKRNDRASIARIAQLTQKTNQFNLTTLRCSQADIESMMDLGEVYSFHVKDRFGDMGIVGVVAVVSGVTEVFLLSCRAFGRRIEHAMLSYVLTNSQSAIFGRYIESQKNKIARDFCYENTNERSLGGDAEGIRFEWRLDSGTTLTSHITIAEEI